jgi:excisionase family DNA binding protein
MTTNIATLHGVPSPEEQPTMRLWPEAGTILGLSRSSTYEAVQRGEIPVLRFGRRIVVPTAALRKMLGLDS